MSISETELALIRTEQEKFMPDTVEIRRKVVIAPGETGDDVEHGVKCRIFPGFGRFQNVADRFQGITPYTITFPTGTDVNVGHTLVDSDSIVYEVRDVRDESTYQTAIPTLCDRIR